MQLVVSASPHKRGALNTSRVMFHVIVGLLPVIAASVYFFRYEAVFLILNCVVTCVVTEEIIIRIRKRPSTIKDGSSVVTGLLLAFVLPPSVPWYVATLGSVVAILVGKQLFGGLGYNIFNPALVGRAFLMAAYPKMMTTWVEPYTLSAVTQATPLAMRKFNHIITPSIDLFLGNVPGCLGETSALCIIIGGLYLLIKKVADWRIPLTIIVTTSVIAFVGYVIDPLNGSVLFHLFGGGLLLGAFFMATDPVTTPVTKLGRIIFGVGTGVMIMVLRYFSGLPEGVMYSILFMNASVPIINRISRPLSFGRMRVKKGKVEE